MKVFASTLLALVFMVSGSAMAGKKASSGVAADKVACTEAQKKAGKCQTEAKANVSTTVAAPSSVRSGSIDGSASRLPASVRDSNTH